MRLVSFSGADTPDSSAPSLVATEDFADSIGRSDGFGSSNEAAERIPAIPQSPATHESNISLILLVFIMLKLLG
jgi:hypothetical protein